ncbi:DUF4393 domain-containing protein [Paenibacillus glucanolyticus]|uniref:DUF4393 domain-containing protein n=1 Tax=Paenibacillus glucanolyticus TaxID=59843 RepID=UPI0021172075|nr:DUF4393 domain-containing protein [Paenibacillus glucanolyticus]
MDLFNKSSDSGLLKEVYTDIAQPGVKKVGLALETVLDFANTLLIPIKLMNEKSKVFLSIHMNKYKENMEDIEENKIAVVPPELGVPILQKLTYTTNETIAEMFINLLTKASALETSDSAHPRFIEMINSMSVDEAKILEYLVVNNYSYTPFILFRANKLTDQNFTYTKTERTGLEKVVELMYPSNINLYLDNLVGLGILRRVDGFVPISGNKMTPEELEQIYERDKKTLSEYINNKPDAGHYTIEKIIGHFDVTKIGNSFLKTCYKPNKETP